MVSPTSGPRTLTLDAAFPFLVPLPGVLPRFLHDQVPRVHAHELWQAAGGQPVGTTHVDVSVMINSSDATRTNEHGCVTCGTAGLVGCWPGRRRLSLRHDRTGRLWCMRCHAALTCGLPVSHSGPQPVLRPCPDPQALLDAPLPPGDLPRAGEPPPPACTCTDTLCPLTTTKRGVLSICCRIISNALTIRFPLL